MKKLKTKLQLIPPIDKNDERPEYSVYVEENCLSISRFVNYLPALVIFVVSIIANVIFFIHPSIALAISILATVISALVLIDQRHFVYTFNKQEDSIHFKRHGILGSDLNSQSSDYSLSLVSKLEMLRFVNRYQDTFQIRLALNSGEKLDLSTTRLSFIECHTYAERIQSFLGPKVELKAID